MYYPRMTNPPASSTPVSNAADQWDARLWGVLFAVCGALFLDGLDVSMVGVALPSIRTDLGISTSQLQWIVSGYVLGYGGLLLLGGRAADLLGRRRVFLIAMSVFAVASLLGAATNDPTLLVATRMLKGASAAFTAPAGLSIITTTFAEGHVRNRALSIYTAFGASGFSAGLVMGGVLTQLGWRWTFIAPAPFAIAIVFVARRLLARDAASATLRRGFDFAGALTITAAMLLLVRGVVSAPNAGWGSPATIASFVLSAALLALFVRIEHRSPQPLVRLGILRSAGLVRANIGAAAMAGCYFGFQFVATLFLQSGLHWSALHMALAFLPAGLLVAFGSVRVGGLVDRLGTGRLIAAGFLAFVAGYALFLRVNEAPSYVVAILPTMLLIGAGFACVFPSVNMQATAGIANEEQGLASGLVQTSFQVGGALMLAVVSAVITSYAGAQPDAASLLNALGPTLAIVTGVAALGLVVAVSGLPRSGVAALATDEA
jgi:MFS family permease